MKKRLQKIINNFNKYKFVYLFSGVMASSLLFTTAYGVTCWPDWDGDRTVESSCDFPVGYKVMGNIYVNDKVVTVTNGTLGIDLSTKKITFTTGRINFSNAKADNSVSTRYYRNQSYNSSSWITNCTAGTVMNAAATAKLTSGQIVTGQATSGTIHCAK